MSVEIASLRIEVDATSAKTAKVAMDDLSSSGRALEGQADRLAKSQREVGAAHGYAGTAAAQAERTINSLVGTFVQARDALGRFTKEDGSFRMSQEATATLMLRNAAAATSYARQQEQAAKVVAKAEADAAREAQAAWKQSQAIQAEVMRERVALARAAEREESQAAKAAAQATATAERERAQAWRQAQQVQAEIMRDRVQLARAAEVEEARLARQQEQAAATTASYAAKVAGLKAQLDPFAAVQLRLAQNTKLLDDAMEHGAITADQHAAALSQVTRAALADVQAINGLHGANTIAGGSMRTLQQLSLNTGRQLTDMGVQIAGGQSFGLILIQQLPQIIDGFEVAKQQGLGFKEALAGMKAEAVTLLAPLAGIGGLLLAVGAALTAAAVAGYQYQEAMAKQQLVAGGLGRLSGLGATDLEASAKAIEGSTTSSIQAAREMANAYASAGVTSVAAISDLGQVTKDLGVTMQLSGDKARDYVADAMRDPAKAAEDLQGKLGLLSGAQLEMIQNMQAAGDRAGAQRVLIDALKDSTSGAADRTTGFAHDVGILAAQMGTLWDILGKVVTRYEQLTRLNPYLAMAQQQAAEQAKVDNARSVVGRLNLAATSAGNLNLDGSDGRQKIDNQIAAKIGGQFGALGTGDFETAHRLGEEIKALTRAKQTYLAPAERAAKLADIEVQAATAKTVAQKVDIAQQRETLNLAGQAITQADAARRIADAGRVAGAQASAAAAKTGAAAAGRAMRADNRGDNEVERAVAAELSARAATTKNIEELAGIKRDQINQELIGQKVRLAGLQEEKKITAGDALAALANYEKVAGYKRQALAQETASQVLERDLAQQQAISQYTDRTAAIRAAMAGTIEEANDIERKALLARQVDEGKALEARTLIKAATDDRALAEGIAARQAQIANQTAEQEQQAREQRLRIFQRDLQIAQQGYQNELDLLGSRKGLAQSAHEAAQFDRRIAGVRYDAERSVLAKTTLENGFKQDAVDAAQARIPVLEELYRNELRALDLSDNMATAYADLVGALSNAARAVIDGDIGGSISAGAGVLRQLSGLTPAGGLSTAFATAASYAGPIGAAVSAVTGVLGAIGDRSAAKAQAKIDRLTKAVDDLRADNKTSSGSIAAALAEANSNWNSDLEYSSAMLSSLRSIDAKTGAVASLIARQIGSGGLLSTKGLGLGSTTTGGGLGAAGLGGVAGAGLAGLAGAGLSTLAVGSAAGFAGWAATAALGPVGLVAGAVGALVGALMKTKVTTEVLDQGLQFTASTFDQIAKGGVTGSSYADLLTTTRKSLLGVGLSTKVKTNTVTGGIDPDLLGQISATIGLIGDGVLSAASVFGIEAAKAAESALGSAVVDLGKLSLKDLKPAEIAEVLQATFDKVGDQLAAAGVPGLKELATVGEGSFETLTRLAREYQVVDVALASISKTFGAVGLASIGARDELVKLFGGLDAFTSQTSFFAQHFLTDAEQLAPVIKAVNDNLKAYGLSADSSRDQFKTLVLAQDLTTESGRATYAALLAVAPAFDKVTAATQATISAAEQSASAAKGYADYLAKVSEASDAAAEAAERHSEALKSTGNAFADAMRYFEDLAKSLKEYSDSLRGEVSGATPGQSYATARSDLLAAANSRNVANLRPLLEAFLKASADSQTSAAGRNADIALARSLALAGSADAAGRPAAIAEIFRSLPGFANGGSAVIGGNPGTDRNVLSINGVPQLNVGAGELLTVQPRGASQNDSGGSAAEIRALHQTIADQAADIRSLKATMEKMARIWVNVTEDGRAMQTEAAA